jgi:transcriptional regulator with PAS, ATPase and Fis domain
VIAATNVDLAQAVKEKKFRLDLYYRLNIININIPPLRDRKEDLVELVAHFVNHYQEAFKKELDVVSPSIINRLLAYDWPGNVREMENLIQRAVLMAEDKMITESDLVLDPVQRIEQSRDDSFDIDNKLGLLPLKAIVAEFEAAVLHRALHKYSGNVSAVAIQLKIGKTALYDKMKQYGLSAKNIKKSG